MNISRRMSLLLRHAPDRAGLVLDPAGWVPVAAFLKATRISRADFDAVVAQNDKRRFAVETGPDGVERVRANQGHSVPVELGLARAPPPEELFHGTSAAAADSIRATGITRGGRHHVHLSADRETAHRVGARRRGQVVVFRVRAGDMARAGHAFYQSANGVWLTDEVPPNHLQ